MDSGSNPLQDPLSASQVGGASHPDVSAVYPALTLACVSWQGPAAGNAAPEPLQLAALLFRLQPSPAVTLHPGGAARHPALHPAPT